MKSFIQNNISLTLLTFLVLGLLVPGVTYIPSWTLPAILGIVIFFACFKIDLTEIKQIHLRHFFVFYILRFILFPTLFYYCAKALIPTFAPALFLLALLPPGTSSPAMSGIFKGNVALAFGLLVFGSLLTPFVMPFMVSAVMGQAISINIKSMLITLILSILLPIIFYLGLRSHKKLTHWSKEKGSVASIILIGLTLTVATAKRKDIILHAPSTLILPLIITILGMGILYIIGWVLMRKVSLKDKISYSLCSGANNLSLGIGIALLYFPPEVCLFLIVAEIPWILAFMPFKKWLKHRYVLTAPEPI